MEEEWVPIPDFEDYLISSEGRVYSLKSKKLIKLQSNPDGYATFSAGRKTLLVSRLVGIVFLPTVEGKTEIDHINQNKWDNRVCNLRWADRSDQGKNRTVYNMLGEKYISKHNHSPGYILQINRKSKYYKTLQEAVEARDEFLATNNLLTS